MSMNEYISVKDKLPPGLKKVIACYRNTHGKWRTVMAQYIPKFTVHCCDFYDDNAEFEADYMDGEEEGYVKEGWHEIIENWDYSGCEIIDGNVSHWMPLPKCPTNDDQDKECRSKGGDVN